MIIQRCRCWCRAIGRWARLISVAPWDAPARRPAADLKWQAKRAARCGEVIDILAIKSEPERQTAIKNDPKKIVLLIITRNG